MDMQIFNQRKRYIVDLTEDAGPSEGVQSIGGWW